MAKGRPLPPWYLDEPVVWPEDHFYMRSFWRLSTERQIGGSTIGPIPYSRIEWFARKSAIGEDEDLVELFCLAIEQMDLGFLEWMSKEHDRHVRMRRAPSGNAATTGGRPQRQRRQR